MEVLLTLNVRLVTVFRRTFTLHYAAKIIGVLLIHSMSVIAKGMYNLKIILFFKSLY